MGKSEEDVRRRVVVVGGSIAGLSCAHALRKAGWLEVVVFERARSVTAAGAGLGLDTQACEALQQWGVGDALRNRSLPLEMEEIHAMDSKEARLVCRDEGYGHRAAYWSELHQLIHDALPSSIVRFGHEVISFEEIQGIDGEPFVKVKVSKVGADSNDIEEVEADLMVAADGSMSQTREKFVPLEKRRYSGYCAWRGVLEASSESGREVAATVRKAYPELGRYLYFDMAPGTHSVLYELQNERLNWLWYINQPEPPLKGKSVTVKADEKALKAMHEEARRTWVPELATLMQATTNPFINVIFDREPLHQFVWGRVVLIGEAAHPTTPHGLRSTNMSILDAFVLGNAISKWGSEGIDAALKEYQEERVPVTAREVLFSRHLGQLKQGLAVPEDFQWLQADEEVKRGLLQRNMHSFRPEHH